MQQPIIYLITSGATNPQTTPASEAFAGILKLVSVAVAAKVSLIQLREKLLSARVLFELTTQAAKITRGTQTKLLVNDRADIARGAGADGVHLTELSLRAAAIRRTFGPNFLIGVSTHSLEQARAARDDNADFAVWGPVFATESKNIYGEPQGVGKLAELAQKLDPFPIVALGGVKIDDVAECVAAGAKGIAGISLFQNLESLPLMVSSIRDAFQER
ncbi:MAG TPA: thiamine phosphate synthase [Pyrinomonadaceae bacterium]|nr:thiamine phosphate synthase [Pyrinomonadaceae bacterium]